MFWSGGGWAWMTVVSLLWIALIAVAVWAVIRRTYGPFGGPSDDSQGRRDRGHRESPQEILDRRYASGEIDSETYTEARERLAGHKPRTQ
ncbi:SHOCT domain-containing protein [Streptomyces diastatochromogenes]|uniref:SHOCT domain-containing protein n=1 Tax=Streptomyces diastatochromogenes TaxID=42236 RepID=UPI00367A942A